MGFSRQEYWSGVPLPSPHKWIDAANLTLNQQKFYIIPAVWYKATFSYNLTNTGAWCYHLKMEARKCLSVDLICISSVAGGTRGYWWAIYGSLWVASTSALSICENWAVNFIFCFIGSFYVVRIWSLICIYGPNRFPLLLIFFFTDAKNKMITFCLPHSFHMRVLGLWGGATPGGLVGAQMPVASRVHSCQPGHCPHPRSLSSHIITCIWRWGNGGSKGFRTWPSSLKNSVKTWTQAVCLMGQNLPAKCC